MKVVVWSGMPVLVHMGVRTHYLFPTSLGKFGHEVYYCPASWGTGIPSVPDYMKNEVIPYIQIVSPTEFYDLFPADVFIYIFTVPFKDEEIERKLLKSLPDIRKSVSCFVYYCLDLWEGWMKGSFPVAEWESEIVRHSTHIFAISPQLCVHLSRKYGRDVFFLPNAIPPWFTPSHLPKEKRHPIAIIVGWTYYRNVEEVHSLARHFPDWDFYWIGGYSPEEGTIGHSPMGNLFFLGDKSPNEVKRIAHVSLVGIIPSGRAWFMYFGNPIKWYIYHGCGLPVISQGFPHLSFSPFYPNTFVHQNLIVGFKTFIENLHHLNYPLTPLEIHSYEHRAKTFTEVIEGKGVGYGKSSPTTTHWRDVFNAER